MFYIETFNSGGINRGIAQYFDQTNYPESNKIVLFFLFWSDNHIDKCLFTT